MSKEIASIKELKLEYKTPSGNKLIINDTSLFINEGEIVGIIGESGSGKTVLTSTLTGLNSKIQVITEGSVTLDGIDVTNFDFDDWEESGLRGKVVSSVFQNPLSSLNPYRNIQSQIIESIKIREGNNINSELAYEEALELLESTMIKNPVEVMKMFPHQLSGGMTQRVVICTILAVKPKLLIFDEPTTALDPSAQAQVIEIIREIRKRTNTAIIIISHDIALVSSIADKISIMYAGKVVERGLTREIIFNPHHPYTWGLLMSIPTAGKKSHLYSIRGTVVQDISSIKGDAFAERNDFALNIDYHIKPPRIDISETHSVYSWLYDKEAPTFTPPKEIVERWKKFKQMKGNK